MKLLSRQLSPACGLITAGVAVDCANLPTKGTNSTLYLANKSEIASYTLTTATNVVSVITMASTKLFLAFDGMKTSLKPKSTMRKLAFTNVHDHEISAALFKVDAPTFTQLQLMEKSQLVAIVINNETGTAGEAKYKIYGLEAGLFMENLVYDPYDADGAQIKFTLKSDPETPETRMPLAYYNTDLATTDTAFEVLI